MAKGQKRKREKIRMSKKRVPFDPMDDQGREQIAPREEPPDAYQVEPWDDKWERSGDPNERSDAFPAKNGAEE